MDYEQWTPLGRGDPLKNDPTYDYVPPVLERVHYWVDPSSRKPDTDKKTEILVLGVSSKKPSVGYTKAENRRDQYDPYLQFVDGSNYNYQRRPFPYFQYYKNDDEPLTILVPPPVNHKESSYQTQMSSIQTTTNPSTSISIDESNLVYQSSSITNDWKGSNTYATIAEPSSHVTWRTPLNETSFVMKNIKNMEADIIVLPPEMSMHKGQVSDDTLDMSNTFVNIGQAEAQVQPSGMDLEIDLSTDPLTPPDKNAPMTFGPSIFMLPTIHAHLDKAPMTLQMTMQTVPPTTEKVQKNFLLKLLKKETTPFLPTTLPPTTTTLSSLTTDPLFKHYRQPVEPLKGPLYLIIQGHSKVKTYGPTKQLGGVNIQDTNEISTDDRVLDYPVRHLHDYMEKSDDWKRESRSNKLQTLNHVVKTNLGGHGFSERSDVRETELVVKYDVSKEATSEVYKKGIVESEKAPSREGLFSLIFEKKS